MNIRNLIFIFATVYLAALVVPAIFLYSCTPEQYPGDTAPHPDTTTITINSETPPYDPCTDPTKFSVQLCIDDNETPTWFGLWDECFNIACQTSWTPAHGFICFRCTFPICEEGFVWKSVQHICHVPDPYSFTVDQTYYGLGTFWEACITFPPDECLAETFPNCYNFTIYAENCPL